MFQKIVETQKYSDLIIHTLANGTLIAGFEVDLFDEEIYGLEAAESMISSLLRELPQGRILRVYLKSEYQTSDGEDHSRSRALENIGFIKNRAFVFLERPVQIDLFKLAKLKSLSDSQILTDFSCLKNYGVKVRALEQADVETLLPSVPHEVHHQFQTIDLGRQCLSLVRLTKQSEFGMDLQVLSHIKDSLPLPYTICCSIQSVPSAEAEGLLRRRSKQNSKAEDIRESRKLEEAQDDLEDVSLNGNQLFRFEWQCLIARDSEENLRIEREEIKRKLESLGEMYIESVGAFSSLRAFYPGETPHFSLLEKDSTLVTYVPLISRGDSYRSRKVLKSSLALHRQDESLSYINPLDPRYESYSWCIFGRPGTGKSVLTNALTRALNYDPQVRIIKIDVGGSHSRETQSLGGVEKTLQLNEPTGINPFEVMRTLGPTKEAVQILAAFLEVLILEEGETKLSKTMKSDLENLLLQYAEASKVKLNLHDFYDRMKERIPRRELLQRWVGSGVYGNAFQEMPKGSLSSDLTSNPLTYFNFSKISQALDPDYAQGGLAAVMAQFNLQMLQKSEHKKRLVFIADETPFFIKKCFSFFNLSIANVRKEGHGFMVIAQKSGHVVIDGDTGILDNSPNRVYFSADGDDETFVSRNQLTPQTLEKIKTLRRQQGEFSECLLKDGLGERVLKIRLDAQEYWSYTSKDEDRQKLYEIQKACPSLKMEEIIQCLALS